MGEEEAVVFEPMSLYQMIIQNDMQKLTTPKQLSPETESTAYDTYTSDDVTSVSDLMEGGKRKFSHFFEDEVFSPPVTTKHPKFSHQFSNIFCFDDSNR